MSDVEGLLWTTPVSDRRGSDTWGQPGDNLCLTQLGTDVSIHHQPGLRHSLTFQEQTLPDALSGPCCWNQDLLPAIRRCPARPPPLAPGAPRDARDPARAPLPSRTPGTLKVTRPPVSFQGGQTTGPVCGPPEWPPATPDPRPPPSPHPQLPPRPRPRPLPSSTSEARFPFHPPSQRPPEPPAPLTGLCPAQHGGPGTGRPRQAAAQQRQHGPRSPTRRHGRRHLAQARLASAETGWGERAPSASMAVPAPGPLPVFIPVPVPDPSRSPTCPRSRPRPGPGPVSVSISISVPVLVSVSFPTCPRPRPGPVPIPICIPVSVSSLSCPRPRPHPYSHPHPHPRAPAEAPGLFSARLRLFRRERVGRGHTQSGVEPGSAPGCGWNPAGGPRIPGLPLEDPVSLPGSIPR